MKKAFTIIKNTLFVLLLCIVGIEIYLSLAGRANPKEQPKIFGFSKAVVLSGSMEPEFGVGDLLIYQEKTSYEQGDIVLFFDEELGGFVTHRIIQKNGDRVITQGDSNNAADGEISVERVQGKVVAVLPYVGNITLFFQKPVGIAILVSVLLLILLAPPIVRMAKGGTDKDE